MSSFSIKMSVFLLSRTDSPVGGDNTSCVVLAADETAAREVANTNSGAEGYLWRDSSRVKCEMLAETALPDVEAGIKVWSKERV